MGRRKILPDAPGVQLPRGSSASPETYWSILQTVSKVPPPGLAALEAEQVSCTALIEDLGTQMAMWRTTIGALPMASLVASVIQSKLEDPHWTIEVIPHLLQLLLVSLVTLVDKQKAPLSVDQWLALDPKVVLFQIRTRPEWDPSERERRVQSYLELIQQCSQATCGVIPSLQDPIRERMAHKSLSYDVYLQLLNELSVRDQRIIELLYFGAPSIESVLALKPHDVDLKGRIIAFEEGNVVYPEHVIFNLRQYMKENPSHPEIFQNSKGFPVERAHLNRCLARAREKLPDDQLTIAGLLR